jgi:outer membrane protein OmpA-like peptidoglycan-associated protein/Tol biopolymer transport system component
MKKSVVLVFSLFCLCSLLYSQPRTYSTQNKKAIKLYENAAECYDNSNNTGAIELLKKAIKEDSLFVEAQGMLGYIYDDMDDDDDAIKQYNTVIRINPSFFPNIYFSDGKLQIAKGDYADAEQNIEQYMMHGKGDQEMNTAAKNMLADCKFAVEAMKHPVAFNPMNMGPAINTELSEYFPTVTVDGSMMLFTRRLERPTGMPGEDEYNEDLYVSFKEDGQWTKARNAGAQINSDYNEGASTISADGNTLIFVSDRPGGYGSCDLYYIFRVGNGWGNPRNMGSPVNTKNWESQPCLASDGKTLYFVRGIKAEGAIKNPDIYVTTLNDSNYWSVPVRLSDTINTPGKEECPFISADNQTLYFCSDGHPGFGGTDIFMSRRLPNGRWDIPVNLGYPINTAKDETGVMIDPNGKLAYFASDRDGGYGGLDLYSFTVPDSLRPQQVTYLKGKVYDANNHDPLIADFTLIDLTTGKVVSQSTSAPVDGTFLVCLPVSKNYALNVSKKGYLFYSENFSLKDINASYEHPYIKNVPLQPIDTGASIVLKNIFFETNKYDLKPESEVELGKLISFLKNNPTIKIEISGHTDNQGTPQTNIILSENRAKAVYTYLIAHSIDASRLAYKGYGQTHPIATNETPEGRQLNRRTEMKITGVGGPTGK